MKRPNRTFLYARVCIDSKRFGLINAIFSRLPRTWYSNKLPKLGFIAKFEEVS